MSDVCSVCNGSGVYGFNDCHACEIGASEIERCARTLDETADVGRLSNDFCDTCRKAAADLRRIPELKRVQLECSGDARRQMALAQKLTRECDDLRAEVDRLRAQVAISDLQRKALAALRDWLHSPDDMCALVEDPAIEAWRDDGEEA